MSSGAGLIAEQWDGDPDSWMEGSASAMARAILVAEILLAAAFATLMLSGWRQFQGFGGMTASFGRGAVRRVIPGGAAASTLDAVAPGLSLRLAS